MAEKYGGYEEFADEQLLADFTRTVHPDLDPIIWLRGDVEVMDLEMSTAAMRGESIAVTESAMKQTKDVSEVADRARG
jgi:hypothetical protein